MESTSVINSSNLPPAITSIDPAVLSILAPVTGILSCIILLENLLVLYVVARKWPKQDPNFTHLIIHLSCADLVSGVHLLWFHCVDIYLRFTSNKFWVLVLCGIWMVSIAASIGGMVNFGSLRLYTIRKAMKIENVSKKRAIMSITLSWSFPLVVLFLPPILGWNCLNETYDTIMLGKDCSQVVFPFRKAYVLLVACLLILAMICLTANYYSIYTAVRTGLNATRNAATSSGHIKRERQVFNTMVIILSLFFVCHAPVAGLLIADFAVTARSVPLISAFKIAMTFSFLTSILNPVVYYWRMPAVRDSFWLALGVRDRTLSKLAMSQRTPRDRITATTKDFTTQETNA